MEQNMSAMEPLCRLIGVNPTNLTKEENFLLEADLFSRICEDLKEVFREQHREYFYLMKFTKEMENIMLEAKFVRLIVQTIISTDEYTIEGIAKYTDTHEDVVQEIYTGQNSNPSATFLRKLIELHRTVRRDLYQEITKKITSEYLSLA